MEFNDLYGLHEDLHKRNMTTKDKTMVNLSEFLRQKASPQSEQRYSQKQIHTSNISIPGQHSKISDPMREALMTNFDSCCTCISAMQEHDLMYIVGDLIDKQILDQLCNMNQDGSAKRLAEAIDYRRTVERRVEKPCKEAEKGNLSTANTVENKKKKLENIPHEWDHRLDLRKQQLQQNRDNQIEASAQELDYLYSNDPQSLLEDADRYITNMKKDIDNYKEQIYTLNRSRTSNQILIDKYMNLKRELGEFK